MPAVTYQDFLKLANAQLRENFTAIQQQQQAKINEVQQILTMQGQNPTAWDYPAGTVVLNASSSNGRSTTFDYGKDVFHKPALVRIVSAVGSTPTATVAIQGSKDNSTWANVSYTDYTDPTTPSSASLTITTAGTLIKMVPAGPAYRYLSVSVSSNTNVTLTVDISFLG